MTWTLIEKEWRNVLQSPKFAATFAVCALLVLLSAGIGLREHRAFDRQQEAARSLLADEMREVSDWFALSTRAFRVSDPLQIFVSGVHHDIGRLAAIRGGSQPKLHQSVYGDDPILAVFRALDLAFIVTAVLSLFAILFTYDAINGEREAGTLKLVLSNAVPRARYVIAKLAGTWLALAVPLLLPLAAAVLLVVLAGIPLDADAWQRLLVLLAASLLYFTLFVALGIAVSALTRRPSTSFLVLLALWVLVVLVVPRAGMLAAVNLVPVPSVAELESQRAGFESRTWDQHHKDLSARWTARQGEMEGMSEPERDAYEDQKLWQWMEEDDAARSEVEATIAERAARLAETRRLREAEQRRLAFALSRVSPASAYQLVATHLSDTGVTLKVRYEDALRAYQTSFTEWIKAQGGDSHNVTFRRRSGGGDSGSPFQETKDTLDLSGMPRFVPPRLGAREAIATTPFDLGLLTLETLLAVAVGFVAFLRYDVR